MTNERGLVVEVAPLNLARLVRVVLEGHEGQVGQPAMGFQIVDKAAQP